MIIFPITRKIFFLHSQIVVAFSSAALVEQMKVLLDELNGKKAIMGMKENECSSHELCADSAPFHPSLVSSARILLLGVY